MNVLIKVQDGIRTTRVNGKNGYYSKEEMKMSENNINYNSRKVFDCEADGSFTSPTASAIPVEQEWEPIAKPTRDTDRPHHCHREGEEAFVKIPMGFLDRFAERRIEARKKMERDSCYVVKSMHALDNAMEDVFAFLYGGRDDQKIASAEFAVGLLCDLENILLDSNITIDNRIRQLAKRCMNDTHVTLFNLISALAEGEKILRVGRQSKSLRSPSWADLLNLL